MKWVLFPCLLACVACGNQVDDEPVLYGKQFVLEYGQSLVVGTDQVEVGFQGLLFDYRCPLDDNCFVAGRARIRLWLSAPDLDTLRLEPFIEEYAFKDDLDAHKRVFSRRYTLTLLQLNPYPELTSEADPEDYSARLTLSLNPVPLETGRLNLVDGDQFEGYVGNPIDGFGIDSTVLAGDSLKVYVAYGGGCTEHDFFLFGSTAWEEKVPPLMGAVIIHDSHFDTCEAFIHEILAFDLTPIREWHGTGGAVSILVENAPDGVLYIY